ncbi:gp145 [Sphingomonas phage PAU]|uniref:gp145 n=1 Tax=Sphingomonas phage PAU TaxID=1150991 RepID=UPI00025732DD|nr:gp145 [Sphingomonas phage PAU]AFF28143.1 gp145 [Sphingomonas phage PAU]
MKTISKLYEASSDFQMIEFESIKAIELAIANYSASVKGLQQEVTSIKNHLSKILGNKVSDIKDLNASLTAEKGITYIEVQLQADKVEKFGMEESKAFSKVLQAKGITKHKTQFVGTSSMYITLYF